MCKITFAIAILIAVFCVVASKPLDGSNHKLTRRNPQHSTNVERKRRHAELAITSSISKNYQDIKRMLVLNNLIEGVDAKNTYSIQETMKFLKWFNRRYKSSRIRRRRRP